MLKSYFFDIFFRMSAYKKQRTVPLSHVECCVDEDGRALSFDVCKASLKPFPKFVTFLKIQECVIKLDRDNTECFVGRSSTAHYSVRCEFVSKYHCIFTSRRDGLYITDISRYGNTYVNRRLLKRRREHKLVNGDKVDIMEACSVEVKVIDESSDETNATTQSSDVA